MPTDEPSPDTFLGLPADAALALFRYAAAALGSEDEAVRVVSEAAREIGAPEGGTVAREALAALLRKRTAQRLAQLRKSGPGPSAPGHVSKLLEAVRPSERDALLLCSVGRLPVAEAASACGVSIEELGARLSRGLSALCRIEGGGSATKAWSAEQTRAVDRLWDIVEGTAPDAITDLVSSDDALRDLVHDASQLGAELRSMEAAWTPDLRAILREALAPREAVHDEAPAGEAEESGASLSAERSRPGGTRAGAEKATEEASPAAGGPGDAKPRDERPLWERLGRRGRAALAAGAVLGLGTFVYTLSRPASGPRAFAESSWSGHVTDVSRGFGSEAGVQRCSPEGAACSPVRSGDELPSGSTLRTDERSRAMVRLADGTRISLDRGTELVLDGSFPRRAHLSHGAVLVDVSALGESRARIDVPLGFVESGSGKWSVRADPDRVEVEVLRGSLRLVDDRERGVGIHAGEAGRLEPGAPPSVSPTAFFGSGARFSERGFSGSGEADIVGLGELRARKPGEDGERKGAVTLASHATRVRIVGSVARTEIEEEFSNGTDDVLEGVFRFPLPADAQIERLALETDGKWVDGAFVDRDRAAAIWRGAIVNAGAKKPVQEEIVWVPGPWRDPALLEWQRGGRFELRIYPIPRHGSRKVILAYTQVIPPSGATRRYVYPLPVDPSGSTRVGRFDVDVEVRGQDEKSGVRARGYELHSEKTPSGAQHLTLHAESFVPSGDLALEYVAQNSSGPVTAWGYQPSPDEAVPSSSGMPGAPFAALALRPRFPRSETARPRRFAIVVDSSRSMFGERYRRAAELAMRLSGELDPSEPLVVLACDATCRELRNVRGSGEPASGVVESFLSSITPEGGSDVTAAIRQAATRLGTHDGEGRIVYIGDGTPTVGAVSRGFVQKDVEASVPRDVGTVTTVAIGEDADSATLSAIAEAGRGVLVPYAPGESVADAAFAVLGVTQGDTLTDVSIEAPEGLTDVTPGRAASLANGAELLVTGRLTRPVVEGSITVRGNIGTRPFEERYPIRIEATADRGNAFVPRLWAAARIAELEKETTSDRRAEAIALSGKFHVASRYTSLLVLESAAMFRAFGLEHEDRVATWTGDQDSSSTEAEVEPSSEPADEVHAGSGSGAALAAATAAAVEGAPAKRKSFSMAMDQGGGDFGAPPSAPAAAAPAPAAKAAAPMPSPAERAAESAPRMASRMDDLMAPAEDGPRGPLLQTNPLPIPRRRMIPMRKIWERQGRVTAPYVSPSSVSADAILAARRDMESGELRRDAVKKLYTLLFLNGDVDQASEVAEKWTAKDPLDPDALTARADVAAARGERELAIRILGSVVDIRPGDYKAQFRLARLRRWAGQRDLGCRHSEAAAQIRTTDSKSLAEAVRCARDLGWASLASGLLDAATEPVRSAAQALLGGKTDDPDVLSGDLRLEASWDGGDDLDLSMVSAEGRISWLGAPTKAVISAREVASAGREGLALRGASPGEYVIEVTRPAGHTGRIHGSVDVYAAGDRRTVPFTLDGERTRVALVKIWMKSKLVPL